MTDGLLVGRFQPFHLGHVDALRFALGRADRLWVGIGSSNRPIEPENPFTAAERREMIASSLGGADMSGRVSIYEIPDVDDHKRWLELIDATVPPFGLVFTNDDLTAHLYSRRDGVEAVNIPFLNRDVLSGTRIRSMMRSGQDCRDLVPPGTWKVLSGCNAASRLAEL